MNEQTLPPLPLPVDLETWLIRAAGEYSIGLDDDEIPSPTPEMIEELGLPPTNTQPTQGDEEVGLPPIVRSPKN